MADCMSPIVEIKGTIETADGKVSEFNIIRDGGWQQWNATVEVLGTRVDALEAMRDALMEFLASDSDDDEEDDDAA